MLHFPTLAELHAVAQSRGALSRAPHLWDGLVGKWNLNEGGGATAFDSSGYGKNGTWNGTGSHHGVGRLGRCGVFNGSDDYVACSDVVHDLSNGRLTVAAWLKPANITSNMAVCGHRGEPYDSSGWSFQFRGTVAGDPLKLTLFAKWDLLSAASWIVAGVWHHVAVTYDRVAVNFYVNGALLSSHARSDAVQAATRPMFIGAFNNNGTPASFVNGQLATPGIWDRALLPSEIEQHYVAPHDMDTLRARVFPAAAAGGAVAPTSILYGPLVGPFGGPI